MTSPTTVPVRREQYVQALIAGSPTMTPQVRAALTTALALALTARSDGSHALLSAAQLGRLVSGAGGERTAVRHLKALRDAGWLEQTSRGGLRGRKAVASVYALCVPPAISGVLGSGPNTPRRKPQQATDGAPLSLSKERDPAHSGARSQEVAHDPVRKQQLEDLFGSYESRGVQGVRSWAAMHLAASGPSRYATTSWIANKAPEFCDLDIYGPPDTGNREVDRILWLNGILPVLREEDFADWSTWGVIDAAVNTAIEHYNLDEPEAWALLYYLAESSKGDGYRVPHRLPDILDRRNAVTDEVIAGGLALLARWRTAASAKFSSPAEPGPAAPTTTPRPPWYVEELDGPRAEGAA